MVVLGEAGHRRVRRVKLGSQGMEVSAQGLGCMGMSFAFGPPKPEQEMIDLIRYAVLELGITFLDTANSYGLNEALLAKALRGIRDKVQLATKFGIHVENNRRVFRGDPEYVRKCCEQSLQRLQVNYIDLYYVHRIDVNVPIEVTMGELKRLVKEGKIKYVGLSDASAATIRRAHAVHPLTAVQLEWSLWTRELEYEVIPTCRELGIGIVPYSPLGRGFLAGGAKVVENMAVNDYRNGLPRFIPENLNHNKELFLRLNKIALSKGCTPAQLALAWLHHQGKDVVPIPGTTRRKYLEDNVKALALHLKETDINEIGSIFPVKCAIGDRYADMSLTTVNSETITLSQWQSFR